MVYALATDVVSVSPLLINGVEIALASGSRTICKA